MSDFLIAYDLVAGDEDEYPDLWNALQLLKAYPIQKSVWRLSGDYTCKDLLDRLKELPEPRRRRQNQDRPFRPVGRIQLDEEGRLNPPSSSGTRGQRKSHPGV